MDNENNNYVKTVLEKFIDDLSDTLGAYANISRLQIISSLLDQSREFSELKLITKLSKTALAHHLEKLVKYGIIENTSRGKYELSEDGKEIFTTIINSYANSKRRIEVESRKIADHFEKFYTHSFDDIENLDVRFERLMPMRVVSFHAVGESPENKAWATLREWAEPKGFFANPDNHPIFGFNNPSPSKQNQIYGYEFWIKVDQNFESEDVLIKDVPEGFYAVTRCIVKDPYKDIPDTWNRLMKWLKIKGFEIEKRWGYEKVISSSHTGNFILDIYIPINEKSMRNK
ncbi:MAG: ArsR family transcriptional regulator [Asgard group archaeon]|nr:ArsR family transcriptional regulator [Asgard group archaeon]